MRNNYRGNYYASSIDLNEGTLIFDTKSGSFLVEGGAHGVGSFSNSTFSLSDSDSWSYQICTFTFTHVKIGPNFYMGKSKGTDLIRP